MARHGLDAILHDAWQAGVVLAGLSAGSMCWFEHGITKGGGAPAPVAGLGFLPGSNSVHYDGEAERRPVYLAAVQDGVLGPGYGVDDGAGLLFRGARLAEVVASSPSARAYRVTRGESEAVEYELEARQLSRPPRDLPGAAPFAVGELRSLHGARSGRDRSGLRRTFGRD